MGGTDDGRDAFDELRFDDDFVRQAATHEPTAEDRLRRLRQEAEEDQRIAALRDAHDAQHKGERRRRRARRSKRFATWSVIVGVLGWVGYSQLTAGEVDDGSSWASPEGEAKAVAGAIGRPTPSTTANTVRLSSQPEVPLEGEHFRFLATQLGSDAPVAYDPCRVIHVVINERTMPAAAHGLVQDAVEAIGRLAGLAFEVDGTTDEPV